MSIGNESGSGSEEEKRRYSLSLTLDDLELDRDLIKRFQTRVLLLGNLGARELELLLGGDLLLVLAGRG